MSLKLYVLVSPCRGEMTAIDDRPLTSDDVIARLLASDDKQGALTELSLEFAKDYDVRWLWACARLLKYFEPYVEYHHDVLWRIVASLFIACERGPEALRDKIVYDEIGPSYLRVVNDLSAKCRFPVRLPPGAGRKRILFVSHFLDKAHHSPTLAAFEYASALARLFNLEVMLLDARYYPNERLSDFVGVSWTHSNRPAGLSQLEFKQSTLAIYTAKAQGMNNEKIVECMQLALQFNPDWVISHGQFNLIGDLLARCFPTICIETTRTEPISQAHSFILFDRIVRGLRMPATGLLPRQPAVYSLSSHLPVPEKTNDYAREQFGLGADGIVYVVVGYRLWGEITDEFEAVLARLLEVVPRAVILTVGGRCDYRHRRLKTLSHRLHHIDFEPDLRALLALCDCYLNPPRQGGGMSALLALAEHVPILTLPNCDVAGVAGNANSFADLDRLGDRAIELGLDAAARGEARSAARAIWDQSPSFDDTVRALWDALVETKEEFDVRRVMSTP
jgi:hypothetical protein